MYQLNGKTTDNLIKQAKELSKIPDSREMDVLLSTGEQISMSKLSILLMDMGYDAISLTGWQAGIVTNDSSMNAKIKYIDNRRIINELDLGKIVIVAGFQGISEDENITTFGRGGSDTTAVAIASSLKAKCYIFSDVDGVYTADPHRIISAYKIEEISYDEMLEMSSEGAKVLHDRCVEVAHKYNVPIIAKSTFNNNPGTVVKNIDIIEDGKIKSIVKNDNLIYVVLDMSDSDISLYSFIKDIIKITGNHFYISDSNDRIEFVIKKENICELDKILLEYKQINISYKPISRIAIIGEGILNKLNTIDDIISILEDSSSNITKFNISGNRVDITLSDKVDDTILEKLHKLLF